jgi:hypothetical protein
MPAARPRYWIRDFARKPRHPLARFDGSERRAARDFFTRWASAWQEWNWEIEDTRANREVVVIHTHVTGRGRESGLPIDMRIGPVWWFRGGKVVRYEGVPSWEEALEAAGLQD